MPSTSLTSLYKPRRRRKLFFLSGTAIILFFVVFALIVLLNLVWIISRSSSSSTTSSSSYRTAHNNNELRARAVPPPKKAGFRSTTSNSGGAVVVASARKEEKAVAREQRMRHQSAESTATSSTSATTTTTTRTTRREKVTKKEKRKKPSPRRSSGATSGNRFAYAFTVGCKPANRSCITYIYNILVAARILREAGSENADIVAFFQLSAESKTTTRLSDQVCRWFKVMNVRLYYIPKYKKATYYSMVMQKFRILSLTEYSRVIFMDADVMPVGDLGYLFDLSVRGILKENFIITSAAEPANGGFFMLAPRNDSIANINTIVQKREAAAKSMGKPWFDEIKGWGREIRPPDRWETHGKSGGTRWSFYAAFADQGLLYHYTKYVRKSVSIVLGSRVQNWGPDPNDPDGSVVLEETLENVFTNNSKASPYYRPPMYPGVVHNCKFWSGPTGCWPPFDSFIHFSGGGATKPWWHEPPKHSNNTTTALGVWYHQLSRLNRELNMGLDLENNWTTEGGGTPLGVRPMPFQATFAKTNLLTKVERDFRAA